MTNATSKRKTVTMTVTVSCPKWLTAAQARKEVRSLINDQAFWGHYHYSESGHADVISEYNFKARSVSAVSA